LKSPGSLSSPGLVSGLAYDSDNEALFVGGLFTSVGGSGSQNFAYYSFKDDDWQGMSTGRVQGLTSWESTIYLIYSQCGDVNDEIPFNAFSISDSDIDVRGNLPIFYQEHGCLSSISISSNGSHVYIGGSFVAQVNLDLAYGMLAYNVEEDSWGTLPIPDSIADSDNFDIMTITEFETETGDTYIAFGGSFTFTVTNNAGNEITYVNIALFHGDWVSIAGTGLATVNTIVYMYDGLLIIGGIAIPGSNSAAVTSYNVTTGEYATIPGLHSVVNTLLLYTESDKNDNPLWTSIYAGGYSATGVMVSNYTDPEWLAIGTVYENMYDGFATVLQYSTGGNGAGGVNGNNSGGGDWWWITLTVIGSLLLVLVVVAVIAGVGYFLYQRKKSRYASIN